MSSLPFLLSQVALETLLLRGPQKPQTHPLADYRYTGDYSKVPMWFCLAETPVNPSALVASSACLGVPLGASSALPEGPVLSGVTLWAPFAFRWTLPSPFLVVPSWAPPRQKQVPLARGRQRPALGSGGLGFSLPSANFLTTGSLSCCMCAAAMVMAPTC